MSVNPSAIEIEYEVSALTSSKESNNEESQSADFSIENQHEDTGDLGRDEPSRGRGRGSRGRADRPDRQRGPRGRHRGRRQGRGDVRSALLVLIAEQPSHGYELMQQIGERSGGTWQPSPGSVYPALQQLQDEGLVRVEVDDSNRGIAQLTADGQTYVAAHSEQLDAVWSSVSGRGSANERELWTKVRGLVAAAKQVNHVGSPAQVAKACGIVDEAGRKLYAVLAEPEVPTKI